VPIILATFPLLAGLPRADMLFHLVFFIVLTSVLFQGTSIPLLARWLKVEGPAPVRPRYPLEFEPSVNIKSELMELDVAADSTAVGKQVLELGLPPGVLIVLIGRNGEFIVPGGGTIIEAGDTMLGLADKRSLEEVRLIVQSRGPRSGLPGPGQQPK
jgi:potassium/hydrogen antiporter